MRRERLGWIVTGIGLALAVAAVCRAEVAMEGMTSSVIILGIIEGPDPIPQVLWQPVREVDPALVLNEEGADRGDGRPDIAYHPVTGLPIVVWAYNNGTDHDIALAEWLGSAWSPVEFLTTSIEDERHPRVFVEPDGTVQVVWWVSGNGRVLRVERETTRWSSPETVVPGGAARPSVVAWKGALGVAYERPAAGGSGREVVLAWRSAPGSWTSELLAATPREDGLDPVLHVEANTLWIDWKHAADALAWSRREGSVWSALGMVPWDASTWVGEDAARELARGAALAGE